VQIHVARRGSLPEFAPSDRANAIGRWLRPLGLSTQRRCVSSDSDAAALQTTKIRRRSDLWKRSLTNRDARGALSLVVAMMPRDRLELPLPIRLTLLERINRRSI